MTEDDLQALKDELEIRNLVGKLATMADLAEDLDEYFDLWTEDGTFEMQEPIGRRAGDPSQAWKVVGKVALRANRRDLRQSGFQGPGTNVWHANTTLHVTIKDGQNAESESYWVLFGSKEKADVLRIGHYHDTYRKTPDGWKIAYRRVTPGRGGSVAPIEPDS